MKIIIMIMVMIIIGILKKIKIKVCYNMLLYIIPVVING